MSARDYREFIASLNAHGVRYLLIGAHAVAFHAVPRATKDLDVLIEATDENARRLLAAVRDFFGGADLGYSAADVLDPDVILQLGVAPVRIDLLCDVPGVEDFAAAWERRADGDFLGIPAAFLGLEDLIRAKEASGRGRDLDDVEVLRRRHDLDRS